MYNDYWMIDQGYIERPHTGDLRIFHPQVRGRRSDHGGPGGHAPDCVPADAPRRYLAGSGNREWTLRSGCLTNRTCWWRCTQTEPVPVTGAHGDDEPARNDRAGDGIDRLFDILTADSWPWLMENGQFLGLITKSDLLNYLRRKL